MKYLYIPHIPWEPHPSPDVHSELAVHITPEDLKYFDKIFVIFPIPNNNFNKGQQYHNSN